MKRDNSFVFGLLAIILTFVISPAGLILGIIAMVKAKQSLREGYADHNNNTARVLGLISVIISSIFLLFTILLTIFYIVLIAWMIETGSW